MAGPISSQLGERVEKVVARLFAAATDFGADAAVLVMSSVEVALFGTDDASHRTGFDHRAHEAEIGRGLPRHDARGCVALIGAIGAQSNDAPHLLDIGLAQAGVGACRTAGATVETLVDTAQERVAIHLGRVGMELDDLWVGHVLPFGPSWYESGEDVANAAAGSARGAQPAARPPASKVGP